MDTPGPVLFDDVTRPCRDITLKPFQQSLVDMVKVYSKRQVDVIYDRNGNIGKSVISNYLYTFHGAQCLPCFNNQKTFFKLQVLLAFEVVKQRNTFLVLFSIYLDLCLRKVSVSFSLP